MKALLYSPPVIFGLFLIMLVLFSKRLSRISEERNPGKRSLEPYACGQRDVEHYVNPDYTQFYQYAFVFTVVHVLILVVATAPTDAKALPVLYVITGILAMLIMFKR